MSGGILAARPRWRAVLLLAGLILMACGRAAFAQDAVQLTTGAGSMVIGSATAGSPPTPVSTATARYRVKVGNGTTKQITASINSAMPAGVTMTISLVAPPGATSAGTVTLGTTAQTVVTNVTNNSFSSNLAITYTLTATSAAGVIASSNKIVTLFVTP
jgi:hypothetical protein